MLDSLEWERNMPAQSRCKACERYESRQENFCRVCGYEFQPDGDAPNALTGIAYISAEKYCGHCGCTRGNCHCDDEAPAKSQLTGVA